MWNALGCSKETEFMGQGFYVISEDVSSCPFPHVIHLPMILLDTHMYCMCAHQQCVDMYSLP